MCIRIHEKGKQLVLWRSLDEALAVLAQLLTGTWSACLHGSGKGWILVCNGSKRFDRNGAVDSAGNERSPGLPVPLRVKNLDWEGGSGVNDTISFDNSTGV